MLYLIGAAFPLGIPRTSVYAFGLAAALAVSTMITKRSFANLLIRGVVSLLLMMPAALGDRELRRGDQA